MAGQLQMKRLSRRLKARLSLLSLAALSIFTTNCSQSGSVSLHNPNYAQPSSDQPTYSVAQSAATLDAVINRGLESDGLLHFEIDGQFVGTGDVVVFVCNSAVTPAVTMLSDSPTTILVSLQPTTDVCLVTVQSAGVSSNESEPLQLMAVQFSLSISSVSDLGANTSRTGFENVELMGQFTGQADQVWTSCDGAPFSAITNGDTFYDGTQAIGVTIPQPKNFSSCQFYVLGNGVQSPTYSAVSITTAAASVGLAKDYSVTLSGKFAGVSDIVLMGCAGQSLAQIPDAQMISDSALTIVFKPSKPVNLSACVFQVQSSGFNSPLYHSGQ